MISVQSLLTFLIALSCTVRIQAAPTDVHSKKYGYECGKHKPRHKKYTANFDDLPAIEDPRTKVPTPYNALAFDNFFVESHLAEDFIVPASGNQYAISYDPPNASISIDYPSSNVKSFSLSSLYYACDQGVPQAECDITILGWRSCPGYEDHLTQVVSKKVVFPALNPPLPTNSPLLDMRLVYFGDEWRDLVMVNFTIYQAVDPGYAGLLIDKVTYETLSC